MAAAALVIGSIAVGSTITQGSDVPAGDTTAAAADLAASRGVWTGGPKPAGTTNSTALVDGGYVFVPINPYRTYDSSEHFPGRIFTGEEQYYSALTDVDGQLQIPPSAVAVTFNITVRWTTGAGGYLGDRIPHRRRADLGAHGIARPLRINPLHPRHHRLLQVAVGWCRTGGYGVGRPAA